MPAVVDRTSADSSCEQFTALYLGAPPPGNAAVKAKGAARAAPAYRRPWQPRAACSACLPPPAAALAAGPTLRPAERPPSAAVLSCLYRASNWYI